MATDARPSEQSSQSPTPGHGAGLQAGPQAVDTASCDGGARRGGANGGGGSEERAGGGSNGGTNSGTNSGGDGTDPKGGGGGGGDAGGGSESGGGGANGERNLHVSYRQVGSAVAGYRQPPGQES